MRLFFDGKAKERVLCILLAERPNWSPRSPRCIRTLRWLGAGIPLALAGRQKPLALAGRQNSKGFFDILVRWLSAWTVARARLCTFVHA